MIKPKRSAEVKRKRNERARAERDDDRRLKPAHMFGDIGPAIAEADYQPRIVQKDPEQSLAAIFALLGRDYGGPLPLG